MNPIEAVLMDACEDQREALRTYHKTGSEEDAACVHFESCPDCCRALETIAAMREPRAVVRTPIRIKDSKFHIILLAILGLSVAGTSIHMIVYPACPAQAEYIPDLVENGFYQDSRTGLCYGEVSRVDCQDIRGLINPDLERFVRHVWHFQDLKTGICYAKVPHRLRPNSIGEAHATPVPCSKVSHLFDAADGRWRYERWR